MSSQMSLDEAWAALSRDAEGPEWVRFAGLLDHYRPIIEAAARTDAEKTREMRLALASLIDIALDVEPTSPSTTWTAFRRTRNRVGRVYETRLSR